MDALFEDSRKAIEKFQRDHFQDCMAAVKKAVEDANRPQLEQMKALVEKALPQLTKNVLADFQRPHIELAQALAKEMLDRSSAEAKKAFEAFGGVLTECQKVIWARGWMVDADCPLVAIVKESETEDSGRDVGLLDEMMLEYYGEKKVEHESYLLESWPNRSAAFEEAFEAAKNGTYRSAVIQLLTLTEYITFERAKARFFALQFKKGLGKPISRLYLELESRSPSMARMLRVLSAYSPVCCCEEDAIPGIVNRHQVLHGADDCYGTEMNYYRCISLNVFLTRYLKNT